MDNTQVMDNKLDAKVARISFFLLALLMISTHVHRHRLTNTEVMPTSPPTAIPLHDKNNMTTSSACTYIETIKISRSNSSTDMQSMPASSLPSPCAKSMFQSRTNSECEWIWLKFKSWSKYGILLFMKIVQQCNQSPIIPNLKVMSLKRKWKS